MLSDASDVEELQPLAMETEINKEEEKVPQHGLWVEKYTPKYFTELLSDDVSRAMTYLCVTYKKVLLFTGKYVRGTVYTKYLPAYTCSILSAISEMALLPSSFQFLISCASDEPLKFKRYC